ncbi:MAG: IS1595 family transposase, partial [Burkholderia sp.]
MPMNRIQFQAGLSMKEFQEQYGNEAQCEAALVGSRWPDGRYQCSSIVGTIFE